VLVPVPMAVLVLVLVLLSMRCLTGDGNVSVTSGRLNPAGHR
jgi:hypothetical protein